MFKRKALWQSLSTRAEQRTLSLMISSHLVKGRFVVIIVERIPALSDKWLNKSSSPSLSKLTYPISSQMTRSNFLKRVSITCNVLAFLASLIWVNKCGTVVKNTLYPSMQAFIPSPIAVCVFPVPGFPYITILRSSFINCMDSSSGSRFLVSSGSTSGRSVKRSSRRNVRLQWKRHVRNGDEPSI